MSHAFTPHLPAADTIASCRAEIAAIEAEPLDYVREANAGVLDACRARLAAVEADPEAWDAAHSALEAERLERLLAEQGPYTVLEALFA